MSVPCQYKGNHELIPQLIKKVVASEHLKNSILIQSQEQQIF